MRQQQQGGVLSVLLQLAWGWAKGVRTIERHMTQHVTFKGSVLYHSTTVVFGGSASQYTGPAKLVTW